MLAREEARARADETMVTDDRINLLARVAQMPHADHADSAQDRSILTLAAASYGARPNDESTVPTGFDVLAAALFERIVEGAYLVATADGVFDETERQTFVRVVTVACGGAVTTRLVEALIADLADQLAEDGLDTRLGRIGRGLLRPEHAHEILRIAALIAQCSEDVSAVERSVLEKLAVACGLEPGHVDGALEDVRKALHG